MSLHDTHDAASVEVLILDADANVRQGLERLLAAADMAVTAVGDVDRARDQIVNRYFSVALLDLDTPTPMGALDVLRFIKDTSPLTGVVVMTSRKAFEAVAPAFRAGAADVIPKTQDSVPYLRDRVAAVAHEIRSTVKRENLLREAAELHEEFLRQMMDLQRQVTDLEDKVLNRDGDVSTTSVPSVLNLLVVDDEPALPALLQRDLTPETGWRLRAVQMGGEALDSASQAVPHVLVVKDSLPDLPGTMVVKTVKSVAPDLVALVFTPPSEAGVGEVKLVESSRLLTLIPSFSDPRQLVGALLEVREGLRKKAHERRYLSVFRKQHFEFLKRYNRLKHKLAFEP